MADKSLFIDIPWAIQPKFRLKPLIVTDGIYESISGKLLSVATAAKVGITQRGNTTLQRNINSHRYLENLSIQPSTGFILVWSGVYYGGAAGSSPTIAGINTSIITQNVGFLQFKILTAASIEVGFLQSATRVFDIDLNSTIGKQLTIVAYIDNIRFMVGLSYAIDNKHVGISETTYSGGAGNISATGVEILCIGSDPIESNSRYPDTATSLTCLFAGCASDKELKSLSENPWQIFKPRKIPINFSPRQPWSMRESRMRGITDLVTDSSGIDIPRYTPPSIESETAEASRIITVPSYVRTTQPQEVTSLDNRIAAGIVFIGSTLYRVNHGGVLRKGASETFNTELYNEGYGLKFYQTTIYAPINPEAYIGKSSVSCRSTFTAIIRCRKSTDGIIPVFKFKGVDSGSYLAIVVGNNLTADADTNWASSLRSSVSVPTLSFATLRVDYDGSIVILLCNGTVLQSVAASNLPNNTDGLRVLDYTNSYNNTTPIIYAVIYKEMLPDSFAVDNPWQIFKSNNTPIFGGGTQ